jgi:4-hydroxyphenylpyruvate dioxygenase
VAARYTLSQVSIALCAPRRAAFDVNRASAPHRPADRQADRRQGMQIPNWDNPVGTDGFEFIEYTAPDPKALGQLFERMGFTAIARHRHKDVTVYRQGDINFIINAEPDSFAQRFARLHGPSICAIAFRVQDAAKAYRHALELGAWGFDNKTGPMELNIPAIKGIGDSLIYFVDRWRGKNGAQPGAIGDISIYDVDFEPIPGANPNPVGHGLTYIDHLTHNVHRGRMQEWAEFYERLFNFREVRYFDIEGKVTGVKSKAMTSPCGKIRSRSTRKARTRPARSRNIWTRTTAKASSTSRSARTTSTAPSTGCAARA